MVKIIENYTLHEQIGQGEYGKVFRGVDSRTKKEVAVKVINVKKFKEYPKLEQCTLNQIEVLSKIDCPHIVKFIQILKTANNFYFFYEFCNQGTLEDLIKSKGNLTESAALIYFSQILQGFRILSSKHIMHRDLKPSNILVSDGIIKLADFGFCKSLQSQRDLAQTMLGSPIYMAPQVLKGEIYTIKADIWSLGVVLYEMLFGFCPFQERSIARLINLLDSQEVDFNKQINNISQGIQDLIKRMLVKDHFKRISWDEIFEYKINGNPILPNFSSNHANSYNNVLRQRKASESRPQSQTDIRPDSRNTFPSQNSPFRRPELSEMKNFENIQNRVQSRPSFEMTQKQFQSRNNHHQNPLPSMFKKKNVSGKEKNKENKENISTTSINATNQKIQIIRTKTKKYVKLCSQIVKFNHCPEVTVPLCLKIYQTIQKQHNKLQETLKSPYPSWYIKEKGKLAETISLFQEQSNKSQKNINGPLITYYVKSLQVLQKENFSSTTSNKDTLIHCLNLLDLNDPSLQNSGQILSKQDKNIDQKNPAEYFLVPKEKLITELYKKTIRNVI